MLERKKNSFPSPFFFFTFDIETILAFPPLSPSYLFPRIFQLIERERVYYTRILSDADHAVNLLDENPHALYSRRRADFSSTSSRPLSGTTGDESTHGRSFFESVGSTRQHMQGLSPSALRESQSKLYCSALVGFQLSTQEVLDISVRGQDKDATSSTLVLGNPPQSTNVADVSSTSRITSTLPRRPSSIAIDTSKNRSIDVGSLSSSASPPPGRIRSTTEISSAIPVSSSTQRPDLSRRRSSSMRLATSGDRPPTSGRYEDFSSPSQENSPMAIESRISLIEEQFELCVHVVKMENLLINHKGRPDNPYLMIGIGNPEVFGQNRRQRLKSHIHDGRYVNMGDI